MTELNQFIHQKQEHIKTDLLTLVQSESPTQDKKLVDQCGSLLTQLFERYFDALPTIYTEEIQGDHLKFEIGHGEKGVLFLVHFDTVWDEGRLPIKEEDGKLFGPGVYDMKSGIVQSIWAVKALEQIYGLEGLKITFLCTSDEEIGSISSRELIKKEAAGKDFVLVTEAPVAQSGALKTSRNGVGIYEITAHGKSSHAGSSHWEGVNAIKELAHQIIRLEEMTNYETGTTVNIGLIEGGTRLNVVPESARATIDFRVKTTEEAERMVKVVESLTPITPGASITIEGELNRPPMERTEATVRLFELAKKAGKTIGIDVKEAHIGGGSDGNFTSGIGIPTIDGLGCYGDGAHADHEHIVLSELPKRTSLIAHMLREIQLLNES